MNKKSQARMLETISVIIIFFFLLMIGFVFYINIVKSNSTQQANQNTASIALKIADLALNMPELQCSKTQPIDNCIDIYKMQAFKQTPQTLKDTYYYDQLKDSTISIQIIYPKYSTITANSVTKIFGTSDTYQIYSRQTTGSKQSIWLPVELYDPVNDQAMVAILTVDYYGQ